MLIRVTFDLWSGIALALPHSIYRAHGFHLPAARIPITEQLSGAQRRALQAL
jgi:hypothetical protein